MRTAERIKAYFLKEIDLKMVNLFRKAVYAYLIFSVIQVWFSREELFGSDSIVISAASQGFSLNTLVNLLSHPFFEEYAPFFLIAEVLFCLLGLFHVYPRICSVLIWFLTININNRLYLMNTGGEQLVNILLFYVMFVSPVKSSSPFQNVLDNAFVFACKFQIVLVYFVSALFKFMQPEWCDGTAIWYVMSMDEFGGQTFAASIDSIWLKGLSWISLAYQFCFPFLVWFRRTKVPLLVVGVLMHVGIMFSIGLFNFSLVMILSYLLFLTPTKHVDGSRLGSI